MRIEAKKIDKPKVAVVVSRFNHDITEALLNGALQQLTENGLSDDHILVVKVPGAVEIPLLAQELAMTKKYQAVIALGAVIRGETSHYDYVCEQVSQGCQKVMLEQRIPVIFGVLTTENEEQAWDRLGGKYGHKGKEAAEAALEMISILKQLV